MDWIKVMCNILDHRKIKMIRKGPEGNTLVLLWLLILIEAGKCNRGGYLMITDNRPYTDETLSMVTDIPLPTVQLALSIFVGLKMIDQRDGIIFIENWTKYQSEEKLEARRAKDRERKNRQRQRERERILALPSLPADTSRDCHADTSRDVTPENKKNTIEEETTTEARMLLADTPFSKITEQEIHTLLTRHGKDLLLVAMDIATETWRRDRKEITNPGGYLQTLCCSHVAPHWYQPRELRVLKEIEANALKLVARKAKEEESAKEEHEMKIINDIWSSLSEAEQNSFYAEAIASMPIGFTGPEVAIIALAKNIAMKQCR